MKSNISKIASSFAFAAVIMASMVSCNKLANNLKNSLNRYDLNLQTATVNFTIPPCPDTKIALSGTQTNYYNIDSFIKANTLGVLGAGNITSVKIQSCSLTLINPSSAINFANFKSCSGGFYSDGNTTPYNLSIANNPDVFSSTLSLPVDSTAELKGYINNAKLFTYTFGGNLRRATTDSIHCSATFSFKVHVE